MKGYPTSYQGMFKSSGLDSPPVHRVKIPIIQRDYAQGRTDHRSEDIRTTFLDTLFAALTGGEPVGLDFVYGEVSDGVLEPLDGQQRLTTLFLLHWYFASRSGHLDSHAAWTKFTYATRPSARLFCERLVAHSPLETDDASPSAWIKDQSWYLHLWRLDPTIDAMLVMLDAIAMRSKDVDAEAVWKRLTDESDPAIWFQLLPIDDMGAADELYIKMNSRGKPLTAFEAFKAQLGRTIAHTGRAEEFGHKIDGAWSDLLWPYRGDNDIVDEEFMHYFEFLLDVCEWREGTEPVANSMRLERRAEALLGRNNTRHVEHLNFIFAAFDTWSDTAALEADFSSFFTTMGTPGIRLFGAPSTNLFHTCCERYGTTRGNTRVFSLTDTLLLYAVLVHRIDSTEDANWRLRSLRNVNEASLFEMRLANMPQLVSEVETFMRTGDFRCLATFNQNQVTDEINKSVFKLENPRLEAQLHRLEDNSILRGTLAAFDLEPGSFAQRADAFELAFAPEYWPALTGGLLAAGEYQRDHAASDYHLFGSPNTESVWRSLLVDRGDRDSLARVRGVLGAFLDTFTAMPGAAEERLGGMMASFVEERAAECRFDWRYYLVRYGCMREGNSGIYYGAEHALGYEMTMLRKTVQRSWYRDPYLYAMWLEAGEPEGVPDPWFSGYSTTPRWMKLERTGASIRSMNQGIAIQSGDGATSDLLRSVVVGLDNVTETTTGWLLRLGQSVVDGLPVDREDRVQRGASLLRALLAGGC